MQSAKKRNAFSLVELMIVVAVTSLLVSLLMPMYKAEKDRELGNGCMSNLKKIGVAMRLYGTDWNGKFPSCGEGGVAPRCYLAIAMDKYVSWEAFRCPADTGDALIGGSTKPYWKGGFLSSFAWPVNWGVGWVNGLPMDNPVPPNGGTSWVWRLPLSRRPVIFDHRPWHKYLNDPKNQNWTNIPGGTASVLYCDGHVGSSTHNVLLAIMTGSGTSEPK